MRVSVYETIERGMREPQRAVREMERRDAALASMGRELASLEVSLALLKLERMLTRRFNPNQPRTPAGEPGGGRWTGGTGSSAPKPAGNHSTGQAAQLGRSRKGL